MEAIAQLKRRNLAEKLQETPSEQHYTEEQLLKVITCAESLQKHDQGREILSQLPSITSENYSEETLQELADTLNISSTYIGRAKALLCISPEAQLKKIKELNARPTFEMIAQNYKSTLLKTLKETFPSEKITHKSRMSVNFTGNGYCHLNFYTTTEKEVTKRPWWTLWTCTRTKTIKEKKELAEIYLNGESGVKNMIIRIRLKDKSFTSVCAKPLEELKKYHNHNYSLNLGYFASFDYQI